MTFTKSFLNTLLFNLATIAAVIVGVVSYAYRAFRVWYAVNGDDARWQINYRLAEFFESLHFKFADLAGEFVD